MVTPKIHYVKKYLYIAVAVLLGFVCLGVIKIKVNQYQTDMAVSNITEQMDTEQIVLSLCLVDYESDIESMSHIEWWYDEEGEKYYLLLPRFFAQNENAIWILKNTDEVWIDEVEIHTGDAFALEEGIYLVTLGNGEEITLEIMSSGNIASFFLKTGCGDLNYLHESMEYVDFADYVLFDESGRLNNHGQIERFRCRGNASFYGTEKKSYRIKMAENSQLLNLGQDKDWLLLANSLEDTLCRNMIANTMSKELGMDYTPDMEYVDLYIDGMYIGNYLLSECIEIENDRLNIRDLEKETELLNAGVDLSLSEMVIEESDKVYSCKWHEIPAEPDNCVGGYLMELDLLHRYDPEASGFITARQQPVVVHAPNYASQKQITYISNLYQDFEDAVWSEDGYNIETGKYFYEYIDVESFAKKYMVEELVKNMDSSCTSFFLYQSETDEKFYAGPLWDYDRALGINWDVNAGDNLNDPCTLFAAVQKADTENYNYDLLYALYEQPYFREYICGEPMEELKEVTEYLLDEFIDENAQRVEKAVLMNDVRWRKLGEGTTREERKEYFNEKIDEIKDFLGARIVYLEQEWKSCE